MVTVRDLNAAGWPVPRDFLDGLSDYEREFIRLEFTGQRTKAYYNDRLRYLGLVGSRRVLDAGCGMGQWALALSECNELVVGIDLNATRLGLARRLASASGRQNLMFCRGRLESLPLRDREFDAIFCYGVFMFTYMPQTLAEFKRVMKPGGRLYLNANSVGWYVHLLRDVPWNRKAAIGMIWNTMLGRHRAVVVTEGRLRKLLAANDFDVLVVGCEGDTSFLDRPASPKPPPGYQRRYWGMRAILEVLAIRRS
ncbi:MAG: class I SAM-dependent methyltransferase [Steroidobacteraceae bacterium]|nr:class I SAM-dependent methyltransferase [Steroidobacteraceae bacterium]